MKKTFLLKTMLLLCALIAGSSSVWAADVTLTAGTNGSTCTVNQQEGIKIGTSKKGGDMTITVPANTTKLILHAAAWKGVTGLSLNISGATASPESIALTADDGISNSSPFTLSGNEDDFKFEITLSGITSETEVKFTTSVEKRCVIWGASAVTGNPSKADPKLSFAEASYNATYGEEFTPPTLNHAAGFTGPVEYTSSDESVARISDPETGELRINKGGTTTITATFAGNNAFNAGSASYTLIVTDNRIATTTTQKNIVLNLADVATLTRLAPIVKDASGNVVAYQYDEWPTEMSFEEVSDPNYIIGSLDFNTGEITLNAVAGTVTLKAKYNYYGVNTTYQPSECTFTITVVSPLENIAALTANTEAGTYQVNLDAVVTYVNGNYAYIQDASGAVVMYKKDHGLTAGDALNGTATVAYQVRNGNPQITDLSGVTPTAGDAPAPTIIAADVWDFTFTDVLSQYFQVTGATLTKEGTKYYTTLDEDKVQLYKVGTALGDLDLTKTYTITGFPTLYVKNETTTKELQIFVDPEEDGVVITDAKYATFVSSRDVDFSTTGITAYTAQVSGSSVALTEITKVPANTPVVLYKADADGTAVTVPTATSVDEVGTNELLVSDGTVTGGEGIYALANGTSGVGFYKVKSTVTIPAGKCYLNTNTSAPDYLGFDFGTTGINEELRVKSEEFATAPIYNLAGQRVAQPTKGLYIVNGKKVVLK